MKTKFMAYVLVKYVVHAKHRWSYYFHFLFLISYPGNEINETNNNRLYSFLQNIDRYISLFSMAEG